MDAKEFTRHINHLQPIDRTLFVSDEEVPGLAVIAYPSGKKVWTLRYRIKRRQRRLLLGAYPRIGVVDARTTANKKLRKVDDGIDPAEVKRADRDAKTFGELGTEYVEWAELNKKSWKEDERRITKHLTVWKHRAVTEVSRADVRDLVKSIGKKTPVEANRVHSLVSKMLSYAVEEAILPVNPLARMKKLNRETSRDRVLSPSDLKAFWATTDTFTPAMKALWRLRLLTLQRLSEVADATWAEFDLDAKVWEIPAERRKNKTAHRVPLTATAVKILKELRTPKAEPTDYIVAGARSKRLLAEAATKFGIGNFRGHDLRRTGTSLMPGVSRFIKARVLGHVDKSVTGIYDRFEYFDEKRGALDSWDRALKAIIEDKKSANIVAFSKKG